MLIEKSISANDVVCVKMAYGDEVIAKVSVISDTTVTLLRPFLMVLTSDPKTGQPAVSMAPFWMLGADRDTKFVVSRSHVICMVLAGSDAKSNYQSQTTGLAMPGTPSGLII